jgi:hypothetical protein
MVVMKLPLLLSLSPLLLAQLLGLFLQGLFILLYLLLKCFNCDLCEKEREKARGRYTEGERYTARETLEGGQERENTKSQ